MSLFSLSLARVITRLLLNIDCYLHIYYLLAPFDCNEDYSKDSVIVDNTEVEAIMNKR